MGIRLRSQVWNADLLTKVCWSCSAEADPVHHLLWHHESWRDKVVSVLGNHKLVCEEKRDCQGEARQWTRTKEALVCERLEISPLLSFPHCHQVFSVLSFVQMFSTLICFPICPYLSPPECFICQLRKKKNLLRNVTRQLSFPIMCQCELLSIFPTSNIAIDKYSSSQPDHHSLECTY